MMDDTDNESRLRPNEITQSQPINELTDPTTSRDENRQRLRMQRGCLAVASYLLIGVYTLFLFFSGQIAPDPIALIVVNIVIIIGYSGYFWLLWTGLNKRFRDPSLTWSHLTLASTFTVFLFGLARTLFAQDLFFFAFVMTILFSAFGLNLKQILATAIPCFGALTALLLLNHQLIPESFGNVVERNVIYLISMGWMITFAAVISRLRQVLSNKNRELKNAMEQLNEIAIRDDLTGTYNRRYLFQALKREIDRSKQSGHPLCIGLLDIDHFKSINDTYGHQVGDIVLRNLILRIRKSVRSIDELSPLRDNHVLSRFGGEEFMIALPLTNLNGAHECAKRVLQAIRSDPFPTTTETMINITASMGLTEYRGSRDSIEQMIGRADEALFKAKNNGRDQIAHVDWNRHFEQKGAAFPDSIL